MRHALDANLALHSHCVATGFLHVDWSLLHSGVCRMGKLVHILIGLIHNMDTQKEYPSLRIWGSGSVISRKCSS